MTVLKGKAALTEIRRRFPDDDWSEFDTWSEERLEEEFVAIPQQEVCGPAINVDKMLVATGFCSSRSEAQRKINEGAVYIDGEREEGNRTVITEKMINDGFFVRLGKKHIKVKPERPAA